MCASPGQLAAVPEESLTQLDVGALPREPEVTVSPRSRRQPQGQTAGLSLVHIETGCLGAACV